MMKHYFTFFLTLLTTAIFAQQDTTLVFSRPGYIKDPLRSTWKQKVVQKDSSWVLSLYDKQVLKEEITYEDKTLKVRKGAYTSYHKDGSIKDQGKFDKGYEVGEWIYYYPNKKVAEKVHYFWGKLNGAYQSYWENGNEQKEGRFVMNKKMGHWKTYYQSGKLAALESYDERGDLIAGSYFDEEGNKLTSKSNQ